ncbi:hypothetical protein Q4E93_12645 [Flavitalea sp. BT771]|uniref:hypothetical protein n=1 Tax=Flavitalea sp. BT771 TaxID=3063329 RepID=UPI0026E27466|nr:hypothetical protein [Flavitalea sp. BT771]MDO6431444.1 hypothetical protein [Flavitalea sp. BT771]MDV6220352.1 hypothetical protein [Flavitalea sp. BT771]
MRSTFTLLSLLIFGFIHGQDLTGVWQGHFRATNMSTRSSLFDDRYKFEVQIAQHDKTIEAVTYSYLSSIFYGKAAANGAVNPKTSKALLQEVKLLEVRNQSGDVCIMTCFLQYSRSGNEEFLEGNYVSMNVRDSSNCGRGSIFLRKVPQSDFYKEPFLVKREKELDMAKHRNPPLAVETEKPKSPDAGKAGNETARPAEVAKGGNNAGKRSETKKPADVAKTTNAGRKPPPPATRRTDTSGATARAGAKPSAVRPPAKIKEPENAPLAKASIPQAPASSTARMDSSTGIGKHFSVITPKVLQSRSTVLTRAITVNTREVILNIYDDGAIDHDTVSIYLDKKMVISHAMLTDRPLVVTLHLDESEDYHELVMVAENEGEIPPNTSLMIVKAGDKEYEVRITSTEQKNAMVTFRYQK